MNAGWVPWMQTDIERRAQDVIDCADEIIGKGRWLIVKVMVKFAEAEARDAVKQYKKELAASLEFDRLERNVSAVRT
jgi:hypothetical protein